MNEAHADITDAFGERNANEISSGRGFCTFVLVGGSCKGKLRADGTVDSQTMSTGDVNYSCSGHFDDILTQFGWPNEEDGLLGGRRISLRLVPSYCSEILVMHCIGALLPFVESKVA